MIGDHLEFRAGRDSYGLLRWVPGEVVEREDRPDGAWLRVLPVNSASEEESVWVRAEDVRSASQQAGAV